VLNPRGIVARLRSAHPATYIATLALVLVVTDVGPADAVRAVKRAVFAQNAGSVSGIKASRSPRGGQLLPLRPDGRFDASVVPAGPRGPRGPGGPTGFTGPTGPQGPRGPSSARIVTPAPATLSRSAGVPVSVAALPNVAAGSYVVLFTAEADYRSAAVRMYIVCELRLNGAVIASTKGVVGEVPGSTGSLNLALVRPINRSDSFDLSVTCLPDQPAVSGQAAGSIQSQALALMRLDSVATD
jgi:hypothetical protein